MANYSDFLTYAAPNPLVTSVVFFVQWGCARGGNCLGTSYVPAVDTGTTGPNFNWTYIEQQLAPWGSGGAYAGKQVNFIVQKANEYRNVANSSAPIYPFTQAYADSIQIGWTPNTTYRTLWYVYANGHYWQMTGTATGLAGDSRQQGCISSNAQPAFTAGNSYTESGSYPCTWTDNGTHAPPQDAVFGNNYNGGQSVQATSGCTFSGGTATVTIPGGHIFSVGNTVTIAGEADCNKSNAAITAVTSTSVSYALASCPGCPITANGTVTSTGFRANISTNFATATIISGGLPVSYELPITWAYDNFLAALETRMQSKWCAPVAQGGLGLICGYARSGYTQGGENSVEVDAAWPSYNPNTTNPIYYSGAKDELDCIAGKLNARVTVCPSVYPSMVWDADLHQNTVSGVQDTTSADAEADYAFADGFGMSTNGLNVASVEAYLSNPACGTPNHAFNGDACYNFNRYWNQTNVNGKRPMLSLQTIGPSTPGTCVDGTTGSMAAVAAPATGCNSQFSTTGFPGLIPIAALIHANTLELYTSNGQSGNAPSDTLTITEPGLPQQTNYGSAATTFLLKQTVMSGGKLN